jgi:hypothetical protein
MENVSLDTIPAGAPPLGQVSSFSDDQRDHPMGMAVGVVGLVLTVCAYAARLYSRFFVSRKWFIEECTQTMIYVVFPNLWLTLLHVCRPSHDGICMCPCCPTLFTPADRDYNASYLS